ncbi:MAG: hypothetical protein IJK13_01370 [Lachnospiraceae bacterium]|nr:hypothetical protein [Lachnospiraceae bacterium]
MNKGKTALLLVLTLVVGLLSSACNLNSASTKPEPRYHYGSTLDFIDNEEIEMVKLSEMEYVHPDEAEVKALIEDIVQLRKKALSYESAESFLKDYYPILTRIRKIDAMCAIAALRNAINQTDPYYMEEYEYCQDINITVYNTTLELILLLEYSPIYEDLISYLGKDFSKNPFSGTKYIDLSFILDQYNSVISESKVVLNNESKTINEWLTSDSEEARYNAQCAFIEQYHDILADIYIDILKASKNYAKQQGYNSYIDLMYEVNYHGNYTSEKTDDFYNSIKNHLTPIAEQIYLNYPNVYKDVKNQNYPYSSDINPKDFLISACSKMGGLIWETCKYMTTYELYDYSFTQDKYPGGYSTYIPYYEAPVIFINPSHCDIIAGISHEFGHCVQFYHDYGSEYADSNPVVAEIYSQAMEYLSLKYTDVLKADEKTEILNFKLMQFLFLNILECSARAAFEEAAYSLNPSEISSEKLDELWLRTCKDFGLDYLYPENIQAKSWVNITHFFDNSCYNINYVTSVITSLEICTLEEAEKGKGIAIYEEMINTTAGMSFTEVFEKTPLHNPLEEETIIKIADFFKKKLELE